MAEEFDVVIVGGGHNGLTTGCYLAKAGVSVCVLDRNEIVGGGAMTEPFPGIEGQFRNTHAQMMMWLKMGPTYEDLELEKYGLEIVPLEIQVAQVFKAGPPLLFYRDIERTCESIAYYSKRDADTYRAIFQAAVAMAPMNVISLFGMPTPPSTAALALENDPAGLEVLAMIQSRPDWFVEDTFESDQLKAFLLGQVMQVASGTDRFGMGSMPYQLIGLEHHPSYGMGVAKGGTNSVAKAMIKNLEANGGSVRNLSQVEKILIENGEATGARLVDGTEIRASKAVVCGAGHWQLVFSLVDPADWETTDHPRAATFAPAIERFRPDELAIFTTHLALEEPPHWIGADENPEIDEAVCVFWGLENAHDCYSQVEDIRAGRLNTVRGGAACTHTVADPSLNTNGKHSTFTWEMSVYDVEGDGQNWDRLEEGFGEGMITAWREYAPNLTEDNIIGRVHDSPLDLERRTPSMYKGSMAMGDVTPDQSGPFRPAPGWADYRTPVGNLYVSSGTCHPMGGIMGAAGRNCASVMFEDLGLKRWWPDFSA